MVPLDNLIHARVTMMPKANHLINVVSNCRYFVLVTLKNAKGPTKTTKTARAIRYASILLRFPASLDQQGSYSLIFVEDCD